MNGRPDNQEIVELIDAVVDGRADDAQSKRLDELIDSDAAARRYYVEHMALLTQIEHSTFESADALADINPPTEAETPAPVQRQRNWVFRHPQAASITAAALITVAALVATSNIFLSPSKPEPKGDVASAPDAKEPEFIAKLSSWQNDVWLDDSRPPLRDPRLAVGKRLVLEAGLIEVTYLTGARVVIEGPAEFVVGRKDEGGRMKDEKVESESHPSSLILHPSNSGYLAHGTLVARIEGEKAQGFYVDTPFARVEDHGTEFGIEVSKNGAADVIVLDGKVDLVREAFGDTPERRVRLVASQGASIVSKGGNIVRHATVNVSMVNAMRRRLVATARPNVEVLPPPQIVSVSSVYSDRVEGRYRAENLFDDHVEGEGSDYAGVGAGPHTLVLDLGREFEVRGVRLAHRQDVGDWRIDRVHKLEFEFDSSVAFENPFHATVTPNLETLGVQLHSIPVSRGRFVRVTLYGDSGNAGASLLEFLGTETVSEPKAAEVTTTPRTIAENSQPIEADKLEAE